jgi:hypothetical protein
MQFTAEQKSQLAKLMATENLTVEHQKIKTARFDPQNRVLYLPIWQNMTGALYDLLCGHEVGHALYTPASGWHDAVVDQSKGKHYKSFLNVVEDARIEKKVKRKYPGLTKQFKDAYAELMGRDFFGLHGRDINAMPFIERLNLYTKSQYTMAIEFSAQEEILVKKVQACETWEDVVRVTDEVYGYSKDEQYEMMLQDFQSFDYSDEYGDDDYDDYDSDGYDSNDYENEKSDVKSKSQGDSEDSDEESDDSNDGDGNGEQTEKQSKSKSDDESDGESTDSDDNYDGQIDRYKDSSPASKDMFQPKCETDDNFRANEVQLLDEKCKEYVYLTFPKPNLKNIITPAKRVQEQLTIFYSNQMNGEYKCLTAEQVKTWVSEFKTKNERYVGLLAKEFEMRKAAKAFSKSKLSDTGDIDINKLATYRFDDNIFRKVMLTPKGKNHGLVLLIDKSGSMSNNMAGSIEQILVLAMFCRKVNIPFVVYGFGDSIEARYQDLGLTTYEQQYEFKKQNNQCFESKIKNLAFGDVYLREYINNKMTNAEFNAALRNMILLKKSYEGGRYGSICGRPDSEHLSNTPLNQAIVATAEVMKKFKSTNNLDMTSLVIVHDGDADWTNYYCVERQVPLREGGEVTKIYSQSIDSNNYNVIIRDNENKFERKIINVRNSETMTHLLLDWFRKTTGSKIFGFFLVPDSRPSWIRGTINHRYVLEDGKTYGEKWEEVRRDPSQWQQQYVFEQKVKEVAKQFKTEKFLVSNTPGFNSFFLVAGGDDLKTESDEIEIDGKVTANKLKTAFMKMNKKKQINRVLVSKFIQGIAA